MNLVDTLKARLNAAFNVDLNFESKWVVNVSDTDFSCTRPNGQVESLNWDELKTVIIETRDKGPYSADVFWYLVGEQTRCVVPFGASGEEVLVKRLQALAWLQQQCVCRGDDVHCESQIHRLATKRRHIRNR